MMITKEKDLLKDILAKREEWREAYIKTVNSAKTKSVDYISEQFKWREIATDYVIKYPLHYDKAGLWWGWNWEKSSYEQIDETDILIQLDSALEQAKNTSNTTRGGIKAEILESLKRAARQKICKKVNTKTIQFNDVLIDLTTQEVRPALSDLFITNPIPQSLNENKDTPVMDKLFTEWVGADYVKTLKQIIAYCCLPEYFLHRIFVLMGSGCNGKSSFLNIVKKFIGEHNICSTELDLLFKSRFEVTKLHKKLVCLMGETNFSTMERTSLIKKLCGQDTIGYEYKNKKPFDDVNYAKILIATNTLPQTHDKTDGFYRRWLIIDFPNSFDDNTDILPTIPDEEYNALAGQCIELLHELIQTRKFHNEGNKDFKRERYEAKSNPLVSFIKENCLVDALESIPVWEFTEAFETYCELHGFNKFSKKLISQMMNNEGYHSDKKYFGDKQWRCYSGLCFKKKEIYKTDKTDKTGHQLSFYIGKLSETPVLSVLRVLSPKHTTSSVFSAIPKDWTSHNNKFFELNSAVSKIDEPSFHVEFLKDTPYFVGMTKGFLPAKWGENKNIPEKEAKILERKGYIKIIGEKQ